MNSLNGSILYLQEMVLDRQAASKHRAGSGYVERLYRIARNQNRRGRETSMVPDTLTFTRRYVTDGPCEE